MKKQKRPERPYFRMDFSDTWHWMPNCHYVKSWSDRKLLLHFVYSNKRPSGDLCNECKAKERAQKRKGK